ncbi:MAG TPA: hypothetical protein VGP63_26895 [Planctomycetaceae bacterium]|jgi:hypothetical protein|nr:hypothetical protein [Planctomycetaceae bacterium]
MIELSPILGTLTLTIGGRPVGTVTVAKRNFKKVFGRFVPNPEFEPYRPIFAAAVELARQFDATPMDEPCNDALWDRLMDAYAEISDLGPAIAEAAFPIEEFLVMADWSVQIAFGEPPGAEFFPAVE